MKVAQYEVLGSRFRKKRPRRDDRCLLTLGKLHARDQERNVSIVPSGTDISSCIISQHFELGYFLLSLRDDPARVPRFQRFNRYVDAHGRPPHGNAEGLEKAKTGWNPGNQSLQAIPNISKFGSAVFLLL